MWSESNWQQIGPTIDQSVEIDSIEVILDSSSRPVLVFTEGATGDIHTMGSRK